MKLMPCCVLALTFSACNVLSEDLVPTTPQKTTEVVVVANRLATDSEKIASSVTSISKEQIQNQDQNSVADVLREVQGVDVVQNGSLGGNTAVFMRGANSEHTLVLIDGVEANNPINPNRSYNFANLSTSNIERIEVLRGPQSTLYGSDALGGVISIITEKGQGAPTASASFEAGSYRTFLENARSSGAVGEFNYSLSASRLDSRNISSADAKFGNAEHDPYQNTAFSTRLGYEASRDLDANLIFRYQGGRADLDNSGGLGSDDPNRVLLAREFFLRGELNLDLIEDLLKQSYAVSLADQSYDDDNDPDPDHPLDILRSDFSGRLLKYELINTLTINKDVRFLAGIETKEERASSDFHSDGEFGPFDSNFDDRTVRNNAFFGQGLFSFLNSASATAGIRVDNHEKFGSEVTYKIAPAYLLEQTGTKFSGTFGTGFKAPSLYQLYSEFGSLDLKPERSVGVDGGIEQRILGDKLKLGGTYFWNHFKNLITFDPNTNLFENTERARTSGYEIYLDAKPADALALRSSLTLLDTKDQTTDEKLLRRPHVKLGFNLNFKATEDLKLNLGLVYVGRRDDNDFSSFPASRVTLPGYAVVNFAAAYSISKNLDLVARVENLFDKDYEEVLGYGTRGAGAYAGFRVKM